MKSSSCFFTVSVLAWQLFTTSACNNSDYKKTEIKPINAELNKNHKPKPPATNSDTLIINFAAAIF